MKAPNQKLNEFNRGATCILKCVEWQWASIRNYLRAILITAHIYLALTIYQALGEPFVHIVKLIPNFKQGTLPGAMGKPEILWKSPFREDLPV